MIQIYGILDPRDGTLRYVGKANDARKRFAGHMRETRRRTPLYDWLAKMRAAGLTPTYVVLLECDADGWEAYEVKAIADARASGARLLNVADGGEEPKRTAESCARGARTVNAARRYDPRTAFLFHAKKTLSTALVNGDLRESTRTKMRLLAAKMPAMFGAWSNA